MPEGGNLVCTHQQATKYHPASWKKGGIQKKGGRGKKKSRRGTASQQPSRGGAFDAAPTLFGRGWLEEKRMSWPSVSLTGREAKVSRSGCMADVARARTRPIHQS